MKKLIYPTTAVTLLLTASCKTEQIKIEEDDCIGPQCEIYEWEMPSSVGSYWIYEWFLVDSLGNDSSIAIFDTVRVVGDTSAFGNVYSIYEGNHYGSYAHFRSYLRDSSGYVVDLYGNRTYALFPSGEILSHGYSQTYDYEVRMSDHEIVKTVPAGVFESFAKELAWSNPDGSAFNVCGDLEFVESTFYHPTKGVIAKQLAYISEQQNFCRYREGRLIDYYIAP